MKAHAAAGNFPDPHLRLTAALSTLRAHADVFENTDRFLQLTSEANAKATLTTGTNVQLLLQLLPSRVRDIDNLSAVKTDDNLRDIQYEAVKKWINKSKENLLLQGTEIKDKTEASVTLITGQPEGYNRGNTNTGQAKWNNGNSSQYNKSKNQFPAFSQAQKRNQQNNGRNPSCAYCKIIQESEVVRPLQRVPSRRYTQISPAMLCIPLNVYSGYY